MQFKEVKKKKTDRILMVAMVCALLIQMVVCILFGFLALEVPKAVYMAVWSMCAGCIHCLNQARS